MFRHSILLAALLIPGLGIAQGLINNGAKIVITNGSNVYVNGTTGHYTSQNSGLITNSTTGGTITVLGNWANNSSNTGFSNDGATVTFASSSAQAIGGSNGTGFYKVNASGGGTKTVNTASTISNLLTLGSSTVFNSNGNTTLTATSTTNGQVAAIPSGSSVTGNTNVQVHFTGGQSSYRGSRTFSAPIDETGLTNKTYKQLQGYVIITGPGGVGNGFDAGGSQAPYAITLTRYNEPATASQSQFTNVATISDALPKGNGAFLFYRGDRTGSNKVNQPFAVPENTIMQWNGPINQGDVTVNLSYTDNSGESTYNGYNLVGNPYPSYIDWQAVTKNNLEDAQSIRIIKPGGGIATYFLAYNSGCSCYSDWTVNNGDANMRYIAPGQAFYVRAKGSGASVTFTENSKSVSSTPARYLYNPRENLLFGAGDFATSSVSSRASSLGTGSSMVRMRLEDGTNKDETILLFKENSSDAATTEDLSYMGGSTVALSTISRDNVKLTVNYLPKVESNTEVRLSVNASVTGTVKLNMMDLSAVENNTVYLKDSYLNKIVDVKSEPSYSFYIDRNVASTYGDNRLSLIITPPSTLPVALSGLKAVKTTSGAKVSWNVASESNILKYEVERSTDAISFAKINEVSGLGKSSYTVIDDSPALSLNYYRVKIYDGNGKTAYSPIASLDYSLNNEANVTVYPNPASDIVKVKLPAAASVKVSIIDLSGREVKTAEYESTALVQQNISDLSEGVYIIQVIDSKTKAILIKEKFGVKK